MAASFQPEVVYTEKWDAERKRWVQIPPTPRRLCYGEGVFRRLKERKR